MANVSRPCDMGNHQRCLGTVMVFPPVDGQRIVACECTSRGCNHAARQPTGAKSS